MKIILRNACLALLLPLLGACALTEATADLAYSPMGGVTQVEGATRVVVSTKVNDARSSNRDRVSVKKNGYGMEMAKIIPSRDPAELVRSAVETELKARGFQTGASGVVVYIELAKFYNDFKPGLMSGGAEAEVTFNAQVATSDGRTLFAKIVTGIGQNPNVFIYGGSEASVTLNLALNDAVSKLFSDPQFTKAIVGAGIKPAGTS